MPAPSKTEPRPAPEQDRAEMFRHAPHPPGALAYAPLHFSRDRVCRFCGVTFSTTGRAQTCPSCMGTPEHKRWIRRNRKRWDRNWKARQV